MSFRFSAWDKCWKQIARSKLGAMQPYAPPYHFVCSLIRCSRVVDTFLSIFLKPLGSLFVAFYRSFHSHGTHHLS